MYHVEYENILHPGRMHCDKFLCFAKALRFARIQLGCGFQFVTIYKA
jgi:hypothetical protein